MRSSEIGNSGPVAPLIVTTTALTVFQALTPKFEAPSLAAILPAPGTKRLGDRTFNVMLSGKIQNTGAATTATLVLASGTDTNTGNIVGITNTGAFALPANTTIPFFIETRLIYDSTVGLLTGDWSGVAGGVLLARAAVSTGITGLNDNNEPVLNFVAALSVAAVNAGTTATLRTFSLEN